MSTAVVSGAVAQLLQAAPKLTPAQVKFVLQFTAQRLEGFGLVEQGAGSLNVPLAVALASVGDLTEAPSSVLIGGEMVDPPHFDQVIKLNVEPLANMLTDVDVLGRTLARDLLGFVSWARELDTLLELRVRRGDSYVQGYEDIEGDGMKELVDTVTAFAESAANELDRLRELYEVRAKEEKEADA